MIPTGPQVKLIIILVVLIATGYCGWMVRGWFEDSKELSAREAMQETLDAAMERESRIAQTVEERLAKLQANERIIDRGVIREIEKPVYQRICLEPELIRLLNAAASGAEGTTAEPAEPLP